MRLSCGRAAAPGCRVSEMLAAGADDGLDELVVRVFVCALHQLAGRVAPIRGFIIRAGEVERTNGIV